MRTTIFVALMAAVALTTTTAIPATASAQETPEEAVLDVVARLFDGMREKDEAKLRSVFHPDGRLHTALSDRSGAPLTRETAVESFIRGALAAEAHIDEVTFDEVVRVDGNLAMAWTPYNVFVDGSFQHCGVDVFVMTRAEEGWKILQLVDTRRRDGCDAERRS